MSGQHLKSFKGEKKALALSSQLEGAAFENYRRLGNDEKQEFDVIAASLKKEFLSEAIDRHHPMEELHTRQWRQFEETPAAFAHMTLAGWCGWHIQNLTASP